MIHVAVTGAGGLLGSELVTAFRDAGHSVVPLTRAEIDLERATSLVAITRGRPQLVVNAAAWTDVDGCARDPIRAMRINGEGAGRVAEAAGHAGALIVQISTNEVFDGASQAPYREEDATAPVNPYGASKLAGELAVAMAVPDHLIIRTSWLFGRGRGFPVRIVSAADRLAGGQPLAVVDDEWGNPTPAHELAVRIVQACALRLHDGGPRVLHLAGQPPTTRFAWARMILARERPGVEVTPIPSTAYERPSRVPPRAVLATQRAIDLGLPPIQWQNPSAASQRQVAG